MLNIIDLNQLPLCRYEVSCTLGTATAVSYFDDEAEAYASLRRFEVEYHANRDATAGIYDRHAWKTIYSWQGGVKFGPRDGMDPCTRIFRDLIAAGQPVMIIIEGGARSFNAVQC